MKSGRKIFNLIAVMLVLLFSVTSLSGCYVISSAKMKYVEGTYSLTSYTAEQNLLENNGITMLMVIRSDGTGYYAYGDNDTPMHISELKCRFIRDTENDAKYSYVEIDFLADGGYQKFGVNSHSKTLSISTPRYSGNIFEGDFGIDYYVSATFTRQSADKDLSYIEKTVGSHDVIPHGLIRASGTYGYSLTMKDAFTSISDDDAKVPFVYLFIEFDVAKESLTAYYMLKSDMEESVLHIDLGGYESTDGAWVFDLGEYRLNITRGASYTEMQIPIRVTYLGEDADAYYKLDHLGDISDEYLNYLIEEKKSVFEG